MPRNKLYKSCSYICIADIRVIVLNNSNISNNYINYSAKYSTSSVLLYQYFCCIIAKNEADIVEL